MYIATSPRARLIQGVTRLAGLAARGASAAWSKRRQQQSQAMAVAQMAAGEGYGGEQYDVEKPCTPCEEEQRRLEADAAAFMRGR